MEDRGGERREREEGARRALTNDLTNNKTLKKRHTTRHETRKTLKTKKRGGKKQLRRSVCCLLVCCHSMRCHVDGWPTAAYFPVPALGKPAKAAASSPARCSAAPGFLLVFSPFSWVFSQLKNKRKRKKTISSRKLGENPRKLDEKKTAAPPCRWGKKENPYPHLGENRAHPLPPHLP